MGNHFFTSFIIDYRYPQNEGFPIAKFSHMDLVKKELFDNVRIKQKHDFFGYNASNLILGSSEIDFFKDTASKEQINRLAKGDFSEQDIDTAQTYRNGRKEKQQELKKHITDIDKINLLDVISLLKNKEIPINSPLLYNNFIAYLEYLLKVYFEDREIEKERTKLINMMNTASFSQIAPYTSYVFTIDLLFHRDFLCKESNRKMNKQDSDWIDWSYIYYFPFIDIFASNDELFSLFLDEYKEYFSNKIKIIKINDTKNENIK